GTALDKDGNRRWFGIKTPPDVDSNSMILSLNWIPLGGFVRPAGEDDPSVTNGLSASPKRVRFTVLAAGPAANLIVSWIILILIFSTGFPEPTNRIRIDVVVDPSPAKSAGLLPGDVVLTANGESVDVQNGKLSTIIRASLGQPVSLKVERNKEILNISVLPRTEWPEGQGPTGIVLGAETRTATYSLPQAMWSSVQVIGIQMRETLMLPARVVAGQLKASEVRFVSPVGVKTISDEVVRRSIKNQTATDVLQFAAILSIALALTNLLPLPALDGGRILFVLIEAVRGKRLAPEREGMVHLMGMFALLTLMVVMVINDVINPVVVR
ncbi:MAG: site-2 protease family protein, partial [Chloroflexi bacterium]|nr:site-2 protease family protein [Chloroflexota bacterium]